MFEWVWTVSSLVWLVIAVAAGAALLVVGWRGRRIGDEPRCRKCLYILTDLPSAICPECGLDSSRRKPRRGIRKIRVIPLLCGVLVLLPLAGALATWWSHRATWVSVAPNSILLAASDLGDRGAFAELYHRVDGLAPVERHLARGIARRGLAARKSLPPLHSEIDMWSSMLRGLDEQNQLTDEEWTTFVLQSVRDVDFSIRPASRAGEPLPFVLTPKVILPFAAEYEWTVRAWPASTGEKANDGEPQPIAELTEFQEKARFSIRSGRSGAGFVPALGVGNHELRIEIVGTYHHLYDTERSFAPSARARVRASLKPVDLSDGDYLINPAAMANSVRQVAPPRPELRFVVPCNVRIVPADSDEDLELMRGPEVKQRLESTLHIFNGYGSPANPTSGHSYPLRELRIRPMGAVPWPIAYDVYLRQGKLERHWITIRGAANESNYSIEFFDTAPAGFADGATEFVLRRTAKIDRSTLDNRVADEEVTLGPIPVDFP